MNSEDKIKLTKFMELSASSNENEAMASIRMANKYLKDRNLKWTHVFDTTSINFKYSAPKIQSERYFNEYMTQCREYKNLYQKAQTLLDMNKKLNFFYYAVQTLIIVFIFTPFMMGKTQTDYNLLEFIACSAGFICIYYASGIYKIINFIFDCIYNSYK